MWFDPIYGENMGIRAEDSQMFDFCPGFSSIIETFELNDLYMQAILRPNIADEVVSVEFVEDPVVTGEAPLQTLLGYPMVFCFTSLRTRCLNLLGRLWLSKFRSLHAPIAHF